MIVSAFSIFSKKKQKKQTTNTINCDVLYIHCPPGGSVVLLQLTKGQSPC